LGKTNLTEQFEQGHDDKGLHLKRKVAGEKKKRPEAKRIRIYHGLRRSSCEIEKKETATEDVLIRIHREKERQKRG